MSQDRPRNESGEFEEVVTEQDILQVFEAHSEEPFLTTAEIAEDLPISTDAVYRRLEQMHDNDLVGKKKTGARSVGWWAKASPRHVRAGDADEADPLIAGRGFFASGEDEAVDVDEELYGDKAL